MNISESGLELIKEHEALRLDAYQDIVGVWTVGYGHTGAEVKEGLKITEDAANALLLSDVETAEKCINNCVSVQLTQGQFDALCSFVFNLGCTALRNSTLLRKLNAGDDVDAAHEFDKWNHAGGKVVAGLTKRRLEEKELFLT
jgi:lysozyme